MSKKFVLIVFILTSGLFSCICSDVVPFWNINDFSIKFWTDDKTVFVEEGTFTSDTLTVILELETEYLSQIKLTNPFINTAMALSCPQDGEDGMKDPLTSFTLSSNQPFNEYDAGASLNDIVRISHTTAIEDFVANSKDQWAESRFDLIITEKPLNETNHIFTVEMVFESGKELTVASKKILWE